MTLRKKFLEVKDVIREKSILKQLLRAHDQFFASIVAFVFFLMLTYIPAENQFLQAVNIVSSIIVFIFIPGFCLAQVVFGSDITFNRFGFSFIFGLLIQSLNVLSLYSIGSLFFYKSIDFKSTIILMSFAFVSLANVFRFSKRNHQKCLTEENPSLFRKIWFSKKASFLYVMFIVSLTISLWFQQFTDFPTTDACHYMEIAQNLVNTGKFTSKLINPLNPYRLKYAFESHPIAYFLMSIFYLIGGVSYGSIKLMVNVVGALLIFPTYEIANLLFNKKTAILATVIVTTNPLLTLFSSAAWGPEILSSLFIITTFYFILRWLKCFHLRFAIFTGLFAFLALQTWLSNFYVLFLFTLPLTLLLFSQSFSKNKHLNLNNLFIAYLMIITFFAVFNFSVRIRELLFTLPVFAILHGYVILRKRKDSFLLGITVLCATILILEGLYLVRTYYYPIVIIEPSVQSSAVGYLIPELNLSIIQQFGRYWSTAISIFPSLLLLSFLSLLNIGQLKENLSLFSFPFFQSLCFALFVSGRTDRRYLISIVPFIVIIFASTLERLLALSHTRKQRARAFFIRSTPPKMTKTLRRSRVHAIIINRRYRTKLVKPAISCILIILLIFIIQSVSQYRENMIYFDSYWDYRFYYYDPIGDRCVVNWIENNVSEDAVLMARGLEWGWMTNRRLVVPLPFDLNETVLFQQILNFNVSFLIVDREFRISYSNLESLFHGGYLPLAEVVYRVSEKTYSGIYIYDTRGVLAYGKTPSITNLPVSEDTQVDEFPTQETYGNRTHMHVQQVMATNRGLSRRTLPIC